MAVPIKHVRMTVLVNTREIPPRIVRWTSLEIERFRSGGCSRRLKRRSDLRRLGDRKFELTDD